MNASRDDDLDARLRASRPADDLTVAEARLLERVLARGAVDAEVAGGGGGAASEGRTAAVADSRHVARRRAQSAARPAGSRRAIGWVSAGVLAAAAVVSAVVIVMPTAFRPADGGGDPSALLVEAPKVPSAGSDGLIGGTRAPADVFGSAEPDDTAFSSNSTGGEAPTFAIEQAEVDLPKSDGLILEPGIDGSQVVTGFIARGETLGAEDHVAFLEWLLAQRGVKSLGVANDPTDPADPPRRGVVLALPREDSGVRQRFLVSADFDRVYAWSLVGATDQGIAYATFP